MNKDYFFAKRKGNIFHIGNNPKPQPKEVIQKPKPNTDLTKQFRDFHKNHPKGK